MLIGIKITEQFFTFEFAKQNLIFVLNNNKKYSNYG